MNRRFRGELGEIWDKVPDEAPTNPTEWHNPVEPPYSTEIPAKRFVRGFPSWLQARVARIRDGVVRAIVGASTRLGGQNKRAWEESRPQKSYEFAEMMAKQPGIEDAVVNDFAKISSNPDVYEVDVNIYVDPVLGGKASQRVISLVKRLANQLGLKLQKVVTPRQNFSPDWDLRRFYEKNPYTVTLWEWLE